ncbi:uroporphyrinogen-III synthase [Fuscibacter oryzae]|uniref:Uroporphyrinogen-III synthase n=1 Tax=Fuscibacter oryzae TaxID=2803939 RepID=A0A8J7STX8_9RHOB|nr:uroporphyrinogen-III synthase [Fuscibacter oryzae]MBL4929030.1 uroporphyrinogen-III synthase [Fuscibacter oryzae]
MAQSQRFAGTLAQVTRLPVVISPLMETRFLPVTLPDGKFSALVLTSESGALAAGRMRNDLPCRAWCVGDRTAQVAAKLGFAATSAGGDAAALIALIRREQETGPLLHLRGVEARGDIAETLTKGGIETQSLVVYDQRETPPLPEGQALIRGHQPLIVPLFSPRSARIFAKIAGPRPGLWLAALSLAVGRELTALDPLGLEIADTPDSDGMLLAVQRLIAAACSS